MIFVGKRTSLPRKHLSFSRCFVIAMFLAAVSCSDTGGPNTLVDDLRAARKERDRAIIDVTRVVERHIKIGTDKATALNVMRDNGFKIYPATDKKAFDSAKYDEAYAGVFDMRRGVQKLWFGDEATITIELSNNKVGRITGIIVYQII
ncbi:MAG: hypothetical protein HYW28_06735 [Rhodospirillales bacterium]|nr:hypothetical protein [Rhodospirillales bacterium]MBI2978450.1 hypothetical protein [Rhodospirillales bacterium]